MAQGPQSATGKFMKSVVDSQSDAAFCSHSTQASNTELPTKPSDGDGGSDATGVKRAINFGGASSIQSAEVATVEAGTQTRVVAPPESVAISAIQSSLLEITERFCVVEELVGLLRDNITGSQFNKLEVFSSTRVSAARVICGHQCAEEGNDQHHLRTLEFPHQTGIIGGNR
eukprot:GHVS01003704.1.p1 GENE.GHVS01003704.1~~GHVS01003704.1.p1  ORF type:complete len:172 (-),score=19.93 GHVS01003704.1:465-980(-)